MGNKRVSSRGKNCKQHALSADAEIIPPAM
jgi:hypothetical protein